MEWSGNEQFYDVVVLGAGLAGIRAAVSAAQAGCAVLLCTKSVLCSGSSFYTLMDTLHCQATIDEADKAVFLQDIEACSGKMNDPVMNRYYIDHIRERIAEFPQMGVAYDKLPEPKLACFASHPHDLYSWTDWPGIRARLRTILSKTPAVTLREGTAAAALLTDGRQGGRAVKGVVLYSKKGAAFEVVRCASVILATGGFGGLYEHNLNSPDVTGDGHALALMAGTELVNLEFNQFIPGMIEPVYKAVFREGTLDYCTGLADRGGADVLRRLLPDDAQYRECLRLRAFHGPFTSADASRYFDIALMQTCLAEGHTQGVAIRYAPELYSDPRSYMRSYLDWLRRVYGADLCRDKVTIAPFFHAANGGVRVGRQCQTEIEGLFACGEAAGGIHGADRLGGNATGSCLVFGHLAAQSAAAHAARAGAVPRTGTAEAAQVLDSLYGGARESEAPQQVIGQVRTLLWRRANILRSERGLREALQKLEQLDAAFTAGTFFGRPEQIPAALQAQHALLLGKALLLAMDARRESRGAHYREDYPALDPRFDKRFCIALQDGALQVHAEPVCTG